MKLICNRSKMAEAFNKAATFAARNDVKPILQMVKIEASDKVTLLASDLEIGCRIGVDGVEVVKPGCAMLPIDRIGGLLKESTDDTIQIELTKTKLTAKTSRGEFAMPINDPEEFPGVAEFDHTAPHFEVSPDSFRSGLKLVALATESEESRYALGSVMIDHDESSMYLIATDGRRMARFEFPCSNIGEHVPQSQVLIRDAQLVRLSRAMSGDGNLKIHARANDCLFWIGNCEFYARMTEGRYPRWRDLPWKATDDIFTTLCGPLTATLRQAGLMLGRDRDAQRGIDLTFTEGLLKIKADAPERGVSEVEMPVAYSGKPTVATLDCDYLGEWLSAVGPETTIEVDPSNGKERILLRAFDGAAQYVLMPLDRS